MTEIPKFYYKYTYAEIGVNKIHKWEISKIKYVDFEVHPMFVRDGVEKNKYYFSSYEGSVYDMSTSTYLLADEQIADFTATTGDKLCSIAGAKPCSGLTQNLTIINARMLAHNRGIGWEQQEYMGSIGVQLLMLLEYASFDSQGNIGLGVVNKAGGVGNEAEITGATSYLGNSTGMASGTNGLVSVSWRGIENFWGNIWTFVDGLNIQAYNKPYVADHNFESDKFTDNYNYLGYDLANSNGYVNGIIPSKYGFLADSVIGSSSTGLYDYYYQNAGNRIALLGGSWYAGSAAGASAWYLTHSASYRNRNISARLSFIE